MVRIFRSLRFTCGLLAVAKGPNRRGHPAGFDYHAHACHPRFPTIRATWSATAAIRPTRAGRAARASRVQFVVNYEEGGERNILHGDATSEAFLSDVLGAQPWPGQRHMNVESMYEYGSRAGFWRLWRLFTERKHAGDRVRRRHRARAPPRRGRGHARGAAGRSRATGSNGSTTRDVPEAEERAHMAEAIRIHTAGDRRAAARLVHRPQLGQHAQGRARRRRLPLFVGLLCGRPALLGERAEGAAPDHPLHARRQRHALHQPAGLRQRRGVLRLSQGCLRPALCRGRARAQDDVGRAALPTGGTARDARRRWRAFSTTSRRATASGSRRGSTSRAIGIASIARSPPTRPAIV